MKNVYLPFVTPRFNFKFTLRIATQVILAVTIAFSVTFSYGQTTVGPNNAGTGQNITGIGTIAWTNPGNIVSNNNANATVTLPNNGSISNYLRGTNYAFAIPANATILGITVTIGKYASNFLSFTAVNDNAVNLVKAGTVTGTNKAAGTWPTSETATVYGGPADLWGSSWTASDINNANFGAVLSARNNTGFGISYTAYVDYIQITVTYQACVPPTIPTLSASANPVCPNVSTTLSVTAGTLNDATNWYWYSGSCGGTFVGTGTSVIVSPSVTTSYFVRGESPGGCVIPDGCGSITLTVHPAQLASDYFRSRASGNWSSPASWERSPDNATWCDATAAPNSQAAYITIMNLHAVAVDVNSTGSTVEILGSLNGGTGVTLSVTGDFIGTGTFTANTGTIEMNGSMPQQLGAFSYNNLSNNNAAATVTATGPVTVNGLMDNGGNSNVAATLDMQAFALVLNGTKGNNGATIKFSGTNNGVGGWGSGTIEYYGSAIGQLVAAGTYGSLTINNANGITLGGNVTVNGYKQFESNIFGALDLLAGMVHTSGYTLAVGADQPINGAGASKYIDGILERGIAAGANSYDFPIGTASTYAPVNMAFAAGTQAGSLAGFTTEGDHPDIANTSFSPVQTVNRTWSFNIASGLATANYDATFNWVGADMDAAFDYSSAIAGKFTAGTWTYPVMGTLSATSAQITGEIGFSDFQIGNGCLIAPTATISGNALICAGEEAVLSVALTGTPGWSYTWSDGTTTGTVSGVLISPSTFSVSPTETKTYTIISVTDGHSCTGSGSGSAKVNIGPVAAVTDMFACEGEIVAVPVTVKNFSNVGAVSLTLNYDKAVLDYDSWDNTSGLIQYFWSDETNGILRFSCMANNSFGTLADDAVLLTLNFIHLGGNCDLEWDDSGDGTKCEFATGAPDFEPFCDEPTEFYYLAGTVTEADPSLVADFEAADLFPPRDIDVQLTDLSSGGTITAWAWSFVPSTVIYTSGNATTQNPIVQFTDGGLYTVTLTVTGTLCEKTLTKTAYIRAGTPGLWDGPVSTDWYTAINWDNHVVPGILTDVIIPTRPALTHNYPHLLGGLTIGTHCNSVTLTGIGELRIDGTLTVEINKTLDIKDDAKVFAGD